MGARASSALLAVYLLICLPPNVSAFWLRFLWKNDLIGPNSVDAGAANLLIYQQTGSSPFLSSTLKYPEGATECQLMQDLASDRPDTPIPGIINVLNSDLAGRRMEYLFFFTDEACGIPPAMIIKLKPTPATESLAGNFYTINLLDKGVPPIRSWKQASPTDPVDREIVRYWNKPEEQDPTHPSFVIITFTDLEGTMGWNYKHIIRTERIEPSSLNKMSDAQVEGLMLNRLVDPFTDWLKQERKFRKQVEDLNDDFGSEGFNFAPKGNFGLGANKVAAYMVQEEHERNGWPVPQMKPYEDHQPGFRHPDETGTNQ